MSDVTIRVENLGKLYHIGSSQARYKTIRESITDGVKAPFRRAGRILSGQAHGAAELDQTIWALKDVSFEVKQGEVVGIIGRNGAGKSTLLKILSRITEPTEGEVMLRGRVGSLLEVGTGFHPELTGRENVYLNGAILGMKREEIDRKFDEIVEFSEIEKFIDTPIKHYSSGMNVRLAFSVAAHLEPENLMVDEVLAVGDLSFQKKCLGKMENVAGEGRTILFVSHDMSSILKLCNRVILLNEGVVSYDDLTDKVVNFYVKTINSKDERDLVDLSERSGQGRVRFQRIWFENKDGSKCENAISGQQINIALDYQSNLPKDLNRCRVSLAIRTLIGRELIIFDTECALDSELSLPPIGVVRILVPKLPLGQGQYMITLFLEVNGLVEDWIESATILDVLGGDYYGTGRQQPRGWEGKTVLVEHQWETPILSRF